jgi:hypothetical protein
MHFTCIGPLFNNLMKKAVCIFLMKRLGVIPHIKKQMAHPTGNLARCIHGLRGYYVFIIFPEVKVLRPET